MGDTAQPRSRAGLVRVVVALLVVGAAAVWYFKLGPGLRPRTAAIAPVARVDSLPVDTAPSNRPATESTPPAQVVVTPEPPPPPTETRAPVAPTSAAAPYVSTAALDRLSDSLVVAIQSYQERARVADCTLLGRGLVTVESEWAAYNAEKRKLTVQLDGTRTQRDLVLYSSVDTVEAHFDRSGCRRP
jgi:hypothetical protein